MHICVLFALLSFVCFVVDCGSLAPNEDIITFKCGGVTHPFCTYVL